MVAGERVQSSELMPTQTELLRCVAIEAADVGTGEGDAEESERKDARDRKVEMTPFRPVVACPVCSRS